ncbi:MAG: hypothetical protein ACKPFK_05990, partial [Dolichospermum sp.]
PNFITARLFEDKSHPLENEEIYDRITFTDAIRNSWTFKNEFEKYPQRWGSLQSYHIYSILINNAHLKGKYPDIHKKFGTSIQRALGIKLEHIKAQYYRCKGEKKEKIIEEEFSEALRAAYKISQKLENPLEDEKRESQIKRYLDTAKAVGGKVGNIVSQDKNPRNHHK